MKQLPYVKHIRDSIKAKTYKWAKESGMLKATDDQMPSTLSEDEKRWKEYFRDHSFGSTEAAKNFADAMEIVTGIKMGRFISKKGWSGNFPPFVCIIPIGNSNSHYYPLGLPAMSFSTGRIFITKDGEQGNNMTNDLGELQIPDDDQLLDYVANLMYRSKAHCDKLILNFT